MNLHVCIVRRSPDRSTDPCNRTFHTSRGNWSTPIVPAHIRICQRAGNILNFCLYKSLQLKHMKILHQLLWNVSVLTMHKTINVSCSYAPMVLAFTSWTSTRIYLEEEIVSTPRKIKKVSLISMVMITTDFGKISCLVVTSANVVSESICF